MHEDHPQESVCLQHGVLNNKTWKISSDEELFAQVLKIQNKTTKNTYDEKCLKLQLQTFGKKTDAFILVFLNQDGGRLNQFG